MLRTIKATLVAALNTYKEFEFKFPQKSRITVLRADVVVKSHVILDQDEIELCIAQGQIASMITPANMQCLWYKNVLQSGATAGKLDFSWLVQNLPSFTGDKITVAIDSDSYAAVTLTAYFTLLIAIKPIGGL